MVEVWSKSWRSAAVGFRFFGPGEEGVELRERFLYWLERVEGLFRV